MISIRQAVAEDREAIFDFIRTAYAGREQYKIPYRWYWQFVDNPYAAPNGLPVWIALHNGRIVGQTAAMPEPVKLGPCETTAGWSVDTFVLPDYRRRGLGRELQKLNQESHPVFLSLKMSEHNARIKAELGAAELSPVYMMKLCLGTDGADLCKRIRRRSPVLGACLSRTGLAPAMASALSASARRQWQGTVEQFQGEGEGDEVEIREVFSFNHEFTELWQHAAHNYDLAVNRTATYLQWKYDERPHVEYRRFIARREGQLCGYVILRCGTPPEPNLGIIDDLVAAGQSEAVLQILAVFAVEFFRQHNIGEIRVAASDERYIHALGGLGFRVMRKLTPMCHVADRGAGKLWEQRHRLAALPSSPVADGPTTQPSESWPGSRAQPQGTRDSAISAAGQSCQCDTTLKLDKQLSTFFTFGDHDLDQFPLTKP